MKNLNVILALLALVFIIPACSEDGDGSGGTDVVVLPETIGGQYTSDLVLVNRVADPNLPDYYVDEYISVHGGATCTIEPGVVIEFASNTGFQLGLYSDGGSGEGILIADGTAAEPITFRGEEDIPAFWSGILIGCNSADIRNVMNHCIVEHAGATSNGYGIRVAHCTNGNVGLLSLTNSTVRDTRGVGLKSEGRTGLNIFSNNQFLGNSEEAIVVHANDVSHMDGQTQFIDNGVDGVTTAFQYVDDNQVHTWPRLSSGAYYIDDNIVVRSGALVIEAGTEIVMNGGAEFTVRNDAYIEAIGTSSAPIIFRGKSNAPSWKYIGVFSKFSPNVFRYCQVSQAGADGDGAFYFQDPFTNCCGYQAEIENCTISNNGACGIELEDSNQTHVTMNDNTYSGNGGVDICLI